MKRYNLAIASDWEYDLDFIHLLEFAARTRELSTYIIWPHNLSETISRLLDDEIDFDFFYDRASDTSPEFLELHNLMLQRDTPVLELWNNLKWVADKANMHHRFEEMKVVTPYTVILPSRRTLENIYLLEDELDKLGMPFIIKPANSVGGGTGVVKGAQTLSDIAQTRQMFPDEKYLLQKRIIPREEDGRRFWFRGFFTCGLIQAVWWNDLTHHYDVLTNKEIEQYHLFPLFTVVKQIEQACQLKFFSTEITRDESGEFIAIDYVNEVCDMRLKSKFLNGVPDAVVERIAGSIIDYISEKMRIIVNV